MNDPLALSPLGALARIAAHGLIVRIDPSAAESARVAAAWAAGGARVFAFASAIPSPAPDGLADALLGIEAASPADLGADDDRVRFVLDGNDGATARRARIARVAVCADAAGIDRAETRGAGICVVQRDAGEVAAMAAARPGSILFAAAPPSDEPFDPRLGGLVVTAAGAEGGAEAAARLLASVRAARGVPLFGAVEHVGLYPRDGVDSAAIADWYARVLGLPVLEARTTYIGHGTLGRIEVMREPSGAPCHVAVRVRDFDVAVRDLEARGHRTLEPFVTPVSKAAYLADPDPLGNLVHIIWRP